VLLDGGKEIAHGEADPRGEWVLLVQDPPLSPGSMSCAWSSISRAVPR
jgi:hypothetical protein